MVWEGRSCNGRTIEGASVGVIFYGDTGSLLINDNSYIVYDLNNKVIKDVKENTAIDARNTSDPSGNLDQLHIQNFFDSIRKGATLNSDIAGGHKSTLLCQLGNIALQTGNSLHIDTSNGRILNDPAAQKFWQREYEPGWESKV